MTGRTGAEIKESAEFDYYLKLMDLILWGKILILDHERKRKVIVRDKTADLFFST